MKKENLALALIIICFIASIIGLVNTFKASSKQDKVINDNGEEKSKILKLLDSSDKIAIIKLNGVISDSDSDSFFIPTASPAERARKYLDKAAKDESVKAVVLRINSPGGTVGASQEVYNAVLRCRKEKPVVVSMGDVAASGGYYIASAANVIVANPGTMTGSIGVIINAMNFSKLFDKIGVSSNVIKSGKFKDIGSTFRTMTKEDKELLQNMIDNTYDQFVDAIIQGRITLNDNEISKGKKDSKIKDKKDKKKEKAKAENDKKPKLTEKILRENADGRILTGMQAYKVGLVDELGDLFEAKNIAKKLSKSKDSIRFQAYDKPQSISEYLLEMSNNVIPKTSMESAMPFSVSHPNIPLWVME